MSPISLPDNIKPKKVFTSDFQYVQLPFPYLRLSWHNGNPHASKVEGAKYYGGWQIGEDRVSEDLATFGFDSLPSYFTPSTEWVADNGKAYWARSARYIYAAPIFAKDDWWEEFSPQGTKVKRHRLDMLVYLASINNAVWEPWGPAVLSASGYAASAIAKSFKDFAKDTSEIRRQFAPGVDDMFFYACLGTFGPDRVNKPAGDSAYVPCQFNKPKDGWNEQHLTNCFVGEGIAAVMVDLQVQADAWAADTRDGRQKAGTADLGLRLGLRQTEFTPAQPEDLTDDIPF